jgi:hypothetical protein
MGAVFMPGGEDAEAAHLERQGPPLAAALAPSRPPPSTAVNGNIPKHAKCRADLPVWRQPEFDFLQRKFGYADALTIEGMKKAERDKRNGADENIEFLASPDCPDSLYKQAAIVANKNKCRPDKSGSSPDDDIPESRSIVNTVKAHARMWKAKKDCEKATNAEQVALCNIRFAMARPDQALGERYTKMGYRKSDRPKLRKAMFDELNEKWVSDSFPVPPTVVDCMAKCVERSITMSINITKAEAEAYIKASALLDPAVSSPELIQQAAEQDEAIKRTRQQLLDLQVAQKEMLAKEAPLLFSAEEATTPLVPCFLPDMPLKPAEPEAKRRKKGPV